MPVIEIRNVDGSLLKTYEIIAEDYGALINDGHLFDMARMNLIEDELVSADQVNALTFRVAK